MLKDLLQKVCGWRWSTLRRNYRGIFTSYCDYWGINCPLKEQIRLTVKNNIYFYQIYNIWQFVPLYK